MSTRKPNDVFTCGKGGQLGLKRRRQDTIIGACEIRAWDRLKSLGKDDGCLQRHQRLRLQNPFREQHIGRGTIVKPEWTCGIKLEAHTQLIPLYAGEQWVSPDWSKPFGLLAQSLHSWARVPTDSRGGGFSQVAPLRLEK